MFYQCHKPSPSTYRTSLATSANPNRTAPCKVTPPSELFVACKYPVKKTRSIYILNPTVIGVMFTITNYILGSGQNLLLSILVGWTPIYQLLWGSLGTRVLTHSLWSTMVYHPHQPSTYGIPLVFTVSPDPQTPEPSGPFGRFAARASEDFASGSSTRTRTALPRRPAWRWRWPGGWPVVPVV